MVDLSSQGNPFFVGDVATLLTFDQSRSAGDGRRLVVEIEKQGGRPAIGLMGLPVGWAARGGSASVDLFDGCTNLRVGTRVMREHLEACTRLHTAIVPATPATPADVGRTRVAPPEALRQCTLRRFGADLGLEGFAEAVFQYLPKQRVLGSVNPVGPGGAGGACRCEEPPRPRRRPAPTPQRESPPALPPAIPATSRNSLNPGLSPILD